MRNTREDRPTKPLRRRDSPEGENRPGKSISPNGMIPRIASGEALRRVLANNSESPDAERKLAGSATGICCKPQLRIELMWLFEGSAPTPDDSWQADFSAPVCWASHI